MVLTALLMAELYPLWFLEDLELDNNNMDSHGVYYLLFLLMDIAAVITSLYMIRCVNRYFVSVCDALGKNPTFSTINQENETSRGPSRPTSQYHEKSPLIDPKPKPPRKKSRNICLIVGEVLLGVTALGLLVAFFCYVRIPTWQVSSMVLNDFIINPDNTGTVLLTVIMDVNNHAYSSFKLSNLKMDIYWNNTYLGSASMNETTMPSRSHVNLAFFVHLLEVDPIMGYKMLLQIHENDGVLHTSVRGTVDAQVWWGWTFHTKTTCDEHVNTYMTPIQIMDMDCDFSLT